MASSAGTGDLEESSTGCGTGSAPMEATRRRSQMPADHQSAPPPIPSASSRTGSLYRFGFLCVHTGEVRHDRLLCICGGWNAIELGPLTILAHPDTSIEWAGPEAVILGHIFSVHAGASAVELIRAAMADGSDLAISEAMDDLSGRFVLIISRHGGRLYHDAFGARSVFYRVSGAFGAGSHAGLVARVFEDGPDPVAHAIRRHPEYRQRRVTYLPGDLSTYSGVRALAPNNFYDVASRRAVRYWPRDRRLTTSLDDFHRHADTYFERFAAFLRGGLTPVLGVTGGIDSRVIMAALRHHHVRTRFVTWADYMADRDRPVVREIVEYLGADHVYIRGTEPIDDATGRAVGEAARENVDHFRGRSRLTAQMHRAFGDGPSLVFVRGYGGEIIRGFYNLGNRPICGLSVPELVRAYNSGLRNRSPSREYIGLVSRAVEDFMERCNYRALDAHGYDVNDMYYWEQRMGMWGSAMLNEMDAAMLSMVGLNCRRLYDAAFGLEPHERLSKEVLRGVVRRYDRGLAEIAVL